MGPLKANPDRRTCLLAIITLCTVHAVMCSTRDPFDGFSRGQYTKVKVATDNEREQHLRRDCKVEESHEQAPVVQLRQEDREILDRTAKLPIKLQLTVSSKKYKTPSGSGRRSVNYLTKPFEFKKVYKTPFPLGTLGKIDLYVTMNYGGSLGLDMLVAVVKIWYAPEGANIKDEPKTLLPFNGYIRGNKGWDDLPTPIEFPFMPLITKKIQTHRDFIWVCVAGPVNPPQLTSGGLQTYYAMMYSLLYDNIYDRISTGDESGDLNGHWHPIEFLESTIASNPVKLGYYKRQYARVGTAFKAIYGRVAVSGKATGLLDLEILKSKKVAISKKILLKSAKIEGTDEDRDSEISYFPIFNKRSTYDRIGKSPSGAEEKAFTQILSQLMQGRVESTYKIYNSKNSGDEMGFTIEVLDAAAVKI